MTTTFDASIWQGRDDTGERGDVTRLFQIVQPADAMNLSGAPTVLGFACAITAARVPHKPRAKSAARWPMCRRTASRTSPMPVT
jgi:hypothetical protein